MNPFVCISVRDQLFLRFDLSDEFCDESIVFTYSISQADSEPAAVKNDLTSDELTIFKTTGMISDVPGLTPLKCIF